MNMEGTEPYLLATIKLPIGSEDVFDLAKHEENCLAILNVIFGRRLNGYSEKSQCDRLHLWRYAQHYLLPEYPPFMRFIQSTSRQSDIDRNTSLDLQNQIKRMRFSEKVTEEPISLTSYSKRNTNISDEEILRMCLQFLDLDEHFQRIWPWSKLVNGPHGSSWIITILSEKSKWLFVECLGRLCPSLVEKKRAYLFSKLSQNKKYEYDSIAADELIREYKGSVPKSVESLKPPFDEAMKISINRLVDVQGETLLNHHTPLTTEHNRKIKVFLKDSNPFVEVNSHKNALTRIAKAIKERRPVLIQGSIGCGKTKIVHHLAELTGHHDKIFQINMSDQLDGRALIGGYSCRDVPGQFQWEDGVATKAVEQGKWLLVEDADQAFRSNAGSEGGIAGILMTLIERKQLHLPSRGAVINAASGFQLFLTQRTVFNESMDTSEDNMLACIARAKGKIEIIKLYDHSEEDLGIIAKKQPLFNKNNPETYSHEMLEGLAEKMVACFTALKERCNDKSTSTIAVDAHTRVISLRDFLKWCKRCNEYTENQDNQLTPEIIVLEAMDCFVNHLPPKSKEKHDRVHGIGRMFQLLSNHIDRLLSHRTPPFLTKEEQGSLTIGRASLTIPVKSKKADLLTQVNQRPFFLTTSAAKVLEFISVAVQENKNKNAEPILLVGETGVGKTSAVQHLAGLVGRKLITVNLNQQTECADLLGGYKPVDLEHFIKPVRERFEGLFSKTFSLQDNTKFMSHLSTCYRNQQWKNLLKLMNHVIPEAKKRCKEIIDNKLKEQWNRFQKSLNRLQDNVSTLCSRSENDSLNNKLLFAFVNGVLAEAAKRGDWILLDEINMAEAEVIECLSEVINTEQDSFAVSSSTGQEGDIIKKHPNFRVFACMNPATDVGKKQLPDGLRSRFTEYFIEEPLTKEELLPIVNDYLKRLHNFTEETKNVSEKIVKFYFEIKSLADRILIDGTGHKPTFSLRTLCRALTVAIDNLTPNSNRLQSSSLSKEHLKRFLLEGFLMCFLTELDRQSYPIVADLIFKHIGGGKKKALSLLSSKLPSPEKQKSTKYCFINIEGFWIQCGDEEPNVDESFILTSTVRQNLRDVVRVVSLSNHAVLLQGETSVGKTSLITYLGEATGNQVVRINNHEHTDIQEYVGAYAVNPKTGSFTFVEGVLAKAMRNGHWVILDELNLAPSDVLEALNRVLDDNRELFIPETQTTIQASGNFRIFATQNPSGKYGGRKSLSRAFRNRFIELHFGELPTTEVAEIIHQHCKIEPKASKKLVAVARELKMSRTNSGGSCDPDALLGKNLTLRDLFRWANRCYSFQQTTTYHNWDQHFAQEGYLVLASKMRRTEDKQVVQNAVEKIFKCKIRPAMLFDIAIDTSGYITSGKNSKEPIVTIESIELIRNVLHKERHLNEKEIIWTKSAVRLAILMLHSLKFKEPVLLVGETGCGKTSIVSMVAKLLNVAIKTVNCHLNSETSDFLGCLRPTRVRDNSENKIPFEWVDGPLIEIMNSGGILLVDEISLADDSVLERMNSVLEPSRSLTLVEGGAVNCEESSQENSRCYKIKAHDSFQFISTMNPGGDFGKKELSPALRNRLVEIWCPSPMETKEDLELILENMLLPLPKQGLLNTSREVIISSILDFVKWFQSSKTILGDRCVLSLRDLVTLISFMNGFIASKSNTSLKLECCLVHGLCLIIFDGLGSFIEAESNLDIIKSDGKHLLQNKLSTSNHDVNCDCFKWIVSGGGMHAVTHSKSLFRIGCFEIVKNTAQLGIENHSFSFTASTVAQNIFKVLRGMQISQKPILLEGTPGVGKTSSITALAQITGNKLTRINLSDQTEISDLFGSDLPTSNGIASFSWQDGPFLAAIKAGHWILLDELNLATQSVLEGLNAALDHRGEIYVPELNRTFNISDTNGTNRTRIFGCQNPPRDGGQRKNLPKSFLNRFIKVYLNDYTESDLVAICEERFACLADASHNNLLLKVIAFVVEVQGELSGKSSKQWGSIGSPWSFNLRDILRWCTGIKSALEIHKENSKTKSLANTTDLDKQLFTILRMAKLLFVERFRTKHDQKIAIMKLTEHFLPNNNTNIEEMLLNDCPDMLISYDYIRIGLAHDMRTNVNAEFSIQHNMNIDPIERSTMESLLICTKNNWMPILVEENQCGRSGKLVRNLAKLYGQHVHTISLNSASDTSELLGGFEQTGKCERIGKIINTILSQLRIDFEKCFLDEYPLDAMLRIIHTKLFFENQINKSSTFLNIMQVNSDMKLKNSASNEISNVLEAYINYMSQYGLDCVTMKNFLNETLDMFSAHNNQVKESAAQFDWVESVLVNVMEKGHWLLIEDANRCNSSILDRLNGLLEENGQLEIGEKGCSLDGNVSIVLPHSNFRLFFTMDPRHGELSPAMRNRGVEIFLEDPHRVTNDQMLSTMKDDTSIWQGKIPIDEFAYYSNASIATRRFELMKGLKTLDGQIFGTAAIKGFLNSFLMEDNADYKKMWNVVKHLALKQHPGFGANLCNVVEQIEYIFNESWLKDMEPNGKRICLDSRTSIVTEIEAIKGVILSGKPDGKLSTLSMKHLWSLIVKCFDDFACFIKSRQRPCYYEDMLQIKELLCMFEWIRHQISLFPDPKSNEDELILTWSIAWFRLKEQLAKILNFELESNNHIHESSNLIFKIAKTMEEISQLLNMQSQQFSLTIRRFWVHLGFSKNNVTGINSSIDNRKKILEASANLYLKTHDSIVQTYNHMRGLVALNNTQYISSVENWPGIFNKISEANIRIDEDIINKIRSNECEDIVASQTQLYALIWFIQSALLANCTINDQNHRKYNNPNKNTLLGSGSMFPPSLQQLMEKLEDLNPWPFWLKRYVEIESQQFRTHIEALLSLMESITGYKTANTSLTQLMCINMSDIVVASDYADEPSKICPKLSITDVPLYSRLSRLNQLLAMHRHLTLEYEGDTNDDLSTDYCNIPTTLRNAIENFVMIANSLGNACLEELNSMKVSSKDVISPSENKPKRHNDLSLLMKHHPISYSKSYDGLQALVINPKALISICDTVCPTEISNVLKVCLKDLHSCMSITNPDEMSILASKLDIYGGLLVYNISSAIGKIDLAVNLKYSSNLVEFSIDKTFADIVAYDTCKSLMPSKIVAEQNIKMMSVPVCSIEKIATFHPLQEEKRGLLSANIKKNVIKRDLMLRDMPIRHQDESFKILHQELEQFRSSNLMEASFFTDILMKLVVDSAGQDVLSKFQILTRKIKTWEDSVAKFTKHLRSNFSSFEDIIMPVLWGISMASRGISMLMKRFEMRIYLPSKPDAIISLLESRDCSIRIASSTSGHDINCGISPNTHLSKLEISRLIYHSWEAKCENKDIENENENTIMYKFNRDPDENVFENETDGHLKQISAHIFSDIRLESVLDDTIFAEIGSVEFLKHYDKLMSSINKELSQVYCLTGDYNGKDIIYGLHCRALLEGIKVLSGTEQNFNIPNFTESNKKQFNLKWTTFCNDLLELRQFIREEICPYHPAEENSVVNDLMKHINAMMSRKVNEFVEKPHGFLLPFDNLICICLEWNKNAPRNQLIPVVSIMNKVRSLRQVLCSWSYATKECDQFLLEETREVALSALLCNLELSIAGKNEDLEYEHDTHIKNFDNRKSLCAPFILFFTSAFVGDFQVRLQIVKQLASIYATKNEHTAALINSIYRYFAAYEPNVNNTLLNGKKELKKKFEVTFRTGKLFVGDEKFSNHFKEATKFKRSSTIEYLKLLKQPAMRFCQEIKHDTDSEATELSNEVIRNPLSTGIFSNLDETFKIYSLQTSFLNHSEENVGYNITTLGVDRSFITSRGTIIANNEVQMHTQSHKKAIQTSESFHVFVKGLDETLDNSREQINALFQDLSGKREKPCAFHPTQKAVHNICTEMKDEFGLRHQTGERYQLSASVLLAEIGMPDALYCGQERIGDPILRAISNYDDFSGMILQSNVRGKGGDTRALATSQRGYNTLSHGMIEIVRLTSSKRRGLFRNIALAAEASKVLKTCYRNLIALYKYPISCHDVYNWATKLSGDLSKQERFCHEIKAICEQVRSNSNRTNDNSNLCFQTIRNGRSNVRNIKIEEIESGLAIYHSQISSMKQVCSLILDSNLSEWYNQIANLNKVSHQAEAAFKNLCSLLPHDGLGIIHSLCRQLNNKIHHQVKVMNESLDNIQNRNILSCDDDITVQFFKRIRSTTEKCLLAIQDTNIKVKELNENPKQNISSRTSKYSLKRTVDLLMEAIKSLRIDQVYQEIHIHIKVLEDAHYKWNLDISPLIEILSQHYSILAESYLTKLVIPTLRFVIKILEKFGLYFGDAANVFKSFLNYKFPSKEKEEDNKNSEDTKNNGSSETMEGCGLGDDEGAGNAEATTKDLESEDIFDTAQKPGEEQNQEEDKQKETKEEDGVEMSEGLESSDLQNKENSEDDSDDEKSDQADEEEDPMDVEEGKTDEGNDLLDDDVWNEDDKDEEKENEMEGAKDKENDNKNSEVKDQKGVDEESDPNNVNDTGEENKRKREDEEPENLNGEDEVEMKDTFYGEEESLKEPEDMPDINEMEEGGINDDIEDDDSGDEQMENDIVDQKLPDFEEEQKDEDCPELDKPSDDVAHVDEQAAGHDRNDTSNTLENDNSNKNPEKSDNVEPHSNETMGTENEGLLDDNAKQQNNNETGKENEQESENIDIDDPMDDNDEDKYLESTDCVGVQRLKIINNQQEKEETKTPETQKIFEHVPEHDSNCTKTIDRVDDNDRLNKKNNTTQEEDKEDVPMDTNEEIFETPRNLIPNFKDEDIIKTHGPQRGAEELIMGGSSKVVPYGPTQKQEICPVLETHYRYNTQSVCNENITEWLNICGHTRNLSSSLAEQLRLILEPTKATKFKGDFRTGKRLNMRKIIPYIASGFRKDRIWLRRTKPSSREYQVIVALDDSSSMRDNAVRKTAYNSLAIICQALSTLDVGKFGILGFGNQAKMVQPLQSNFSPEDGAHILNTFTFEQTSTNVASMLSMARKAFSECSFTSSANTIIFEKLLIIVSDGRGIFNEGKDTVLESVRSARMENIFIIFLIVENMGTDEANNKAKDSILDIRMASFDSSGIPTVVPYMEEFPFSHYVILRNVESLPQGLSDALRQWFSMVAPNH